MKKTLFLMILAVCAVFLSSCATFFSNDYETVSVNSNPVGATVKIDGIDRGVTPTSTVLQTDRTYSVEISKPGYATQVVTVRKSIKWGWQVLDLFTTGIVGNVVDLLNPKGYTLEPNEVMVYLPEVK